MKKLRTRVRKGEEETNKVYKKWEKKYYKYMKVMRGEEQRWRTYM
jgi:hypothetical protein